MTNQKANLVCVILVIVTFVITSCTKIVTIDIPETEQKLTLFGLVGNAEHFKVLIGKTYGIMDYVNYDTLPENERATVKLFVNNNFSEILSNNGNYYYSSKYIPKQKDSIVIIAQTNKGDTLVAGSLIPEPVLLDTLTFKDSAFYDKEGYLKSQVTITFNDMPNSNNYYEIYFRVQCDESNPNDLINVYEYSSVSPIILNENVLDFEPQSVIFSDQLFDGKEVNIPISFDYPCFDEKTRGNVGKRFKIIVYFLSVTKEYYNYRRTLYQHLFLQHSSIWDGAAEPINMFSNVKGGYGVFAGYSLSTYFLYSD